MPRSLCTVEGCNRINHARGLCQTHHKQYQRGKTFAPIRAYAVPERACTFKGCKCIAYCKGLCSGHYSQQRRGNALTPLGPTSGRAARHTLLHWKKLSKAAVAHICVDGNWQAAR